MFIKKHQSKVRITHSTNKSIRPIFNLCKINAQQVIKNHISKEDKYKFALNELSNYLGTKDITKIEGYDVSHISGENVIIRLNTPISATLFTGEKEEDTKTMLLMPVRLNN